MEELYCFTATGRIDWRSVFEVAALSLLVVVLLCWTLVQHQRTDSDCWWKETDTFIADFHKPVSHHCSSLQSSRCNHTVTLGNTLLLWSWYFTGTGIFLVCVNVFQIWQPSEWKPCTNLATAATFQRLDAEGDMLRGTDSHHVGEWLRSCLCYWVLRRAEWETISVWGWIVTSQINSLSLLWPTMKS